MWEYEIMRSDWSSDVCSSDLALGNEFNHLEQNVEAGLNDPPTLAELSVMSLYSQAISIPFAQHIRSLTLTLGTRAQIPAGHMVKTLRSQSTCDSNMPSD